MSKTVTNEQVETLFDNIGDLVKETLNPKKKTKTKKLPQVKEVKDSEDKIKIGLWFIKKMGGVESARRVINAAESALKELEG